MCSDVTRAVEIHRTMTPHQMALRIVELEALGVDLAESDWQDGAELGPTQADYRELQVQHDALQTRLHLAERALRSAGYTHLSPANEWKPPLGPSASPLLARINHLSGLVDTYDHERQLYREQRDALASLLREARPITAYAIEIFDWEGGGVGTDEAKMLLSHIDALLPRDGQTTEPVGKGVV